VPPVSLCVCENFKPFISTYIYNDQTPIDLCLGHMLYISFRAVAALTELRHMYLFVFLVNKHEFFLHLNVLGGVIFRMTLGSGAPLFAIRTAFVTSRRGHWPLLICVSGFTWRGSMLLELLAFIRVT
jgi:hypothetical protein